MLQSSSVGVLAERLRADVMRLAAGERLPSSRALVHRYGVSPVTVSRAIALLVSEGLVVTRPGSGAFAAPRKARPRESLDTSWQAAALADRSTETRSASDLLSPPSANILALAGGYLHRSMQPTRALGAALARAARRPDAWDRAPPAGLSPLRAIFARMAGGDLTPDDVLVTDGGQSAISAVVRAITPPDRPVLVESPTYTGALAAVRAAGLRPMPVPIDDGGIRPELLADAFAATGARVLYSQPTFHNPTGTVLARERRRQLLDVVRAAGAFLVEDDAARHLGHAGPSPPPLIADDEHASVIYIASLTKPASPSLRVGALIARGQVMQRLRDTRLVENFFVARPLQEAAIDLLTMPVWDRHLRTLASALRERRTVLAEHLLRALPEWELTSPPAGGFHLWLRLPPRHAGVAGLAIAHGVAVGVGEHYFAAEAPAAFLRLSFAAVAAPGELAEAVLRLRSAASALTPP